MAGTTGNVHKVSIEFCISAMFACSKYSAKQGVMKYNSGGFSFGRIVLRKTTRTLLPPTQNTRNQTEENPKNHNKTQTQKFTEYFTFFIYLEQEYILVQVNVADITYIYKKYQYPFLKRIFVCVFFPLYSCSFNSLLQNYLKNIYPWLGLCKIKHIQLV